MNHDRLPRDRVIVSICGPSGSGKTVLTKELVEQLGPGVAARIPGDRYLVPARGPLDAYLRRPLQYDWDLLDRALAVPDGTAVATPRFDFQRFARRDQPDRRTLITHRLLIVDAIYPHPSATVRVLVSAPDDRRWARLVSRDAARGSHSAE